MTDEGELLRGNRPFVLFRLARVFASAVAGARARIAAVTRGRGERFRKPGGDRRPARARSVVLGGVGTLAVVVLRMRLFPALANIDRPESPAIVTEIKAPSLRGQSKK